MTTQLDAGVGARNVEESGTIRGADPHVFDHLGLCGKIGCLCPLVASKPAAEPRIRFLTIFPLTTA
jgi:hypothetical protein